jgi:hypothetical protein
VRSIYADRKHKIVKIYIMNNLIPSKGSNLLPASRANEMIELYRENKEVILATDYKNTDVLAFSETFNAEDVKLLLSQPGCIGFRIKFGMDDKLWLHSILVGVDNNGNDILIHNPGMGLKDDEGYVVENATRCPPDCPTLN